MPQPEHSANPPQDRVVRVFISSTFRDMQAEREELVKRVFPQLRKLCEERGVGFVDVDLRWGVTDEEAAEGKVLPICLAEIDRCRPFFIGLLGERYGWVPQQIPDELAELQPWLAEHREKSVTELEILHGVLNRPEMANRAIFYLRDPEYVDRIPPAQRSDFLEQDPQRRARLEALKGSIRRSGLAVRENYVDPQSLGQWVLEDLTVAINQMFPVTEVPGPLDREAAEHDAFARSRIGVYIGRQDYFDCLNEYAAGNGPPLVVLGESGSGKSALLANWANHYRAEHPGELVLVHFIGATPYSADGAAMLRRIMGELKRRFAIEQEIPDKPDALRAAFANWLSVAAARGRVILVLDALNQLDDRDGAPDLVWLPPEIPGNVRLMLSTLPGRPLDDLTRRGWPVLAVAPLETEERKELIRDYLAQYTKKLHVDRMERIAQAKQAANPLYLRALLDELRVFGVHERLDERIDHYLAAQTVPDLYRRVLQRWEEDYERDRPGLVRDAMTALWAARRGLSESELLELLGSDDQPLPRAHWSPLFLAAERSLVVRSGLIGFFHDFLREAVRRQYVSSEQSQQAAHRRLADSFERRPLRARIADELPWQLCRAEDWDRLHRCIASIEMLDLLNTDNTRHELLGYWRSLGDRFDMVAGYQQSLSAQQASGSSDMGLLRSIGSVAHFFLHLRLVNEAEVLYHQALTICERILGEQDMSTASCVASLSTVYCLKGDYRQAVEFARRAADIEERIVGTAHPDTAQCFDTLAECLRASGNLAEAESAALRALEARTKLYGEQHHAVARSMAHLAMICSERGSLDTAQCYARRANAFMEGHFGLQHPATAESMVILADILRKQHHYIEAEPLLRKALEIRERTLGAEHNDTAQSLNDLALVIRELGDKRGAQVLYRRALAILEKIYGPENPLVATCLSNLALVTRDLGDREDAERIFRRALDLCRKRLAPDHPDLGVLMHNFASVLKDIGKLDESERLYKSALVTLEKTFGSDHSTTRACKMGLGDVLVAKGEQGEGDSLRGDALFGELVDSLRSRPSTGPVHDLVGFLKQELMAADMNYGPEHDLSVYILRTLVEELSKKGRFDEIEPYLQRAYVLTNASSEAIVCLKTFGHLLRAHNDSERSARFLKRARELFAQVSPSATAEMRTLFKCESCATELNAQAIPIGTQVQCPHCHQEQAVPAHGKSFVVWKCNCGLELQIDAKSSGEKYMCPHCKRQDGLVPFAEDQ